MKSIIQAFVKLVVFWLRIRTPLTPGYCECGHPRCSHRKGKGACAGHFPPCEEHKDWRTCACLLFIEDEDEGDDDRTETPSPTDLERMFQG
jgi:hypothetical protein